VSKALGDLRDSFRAMIRTAQSIHSLLPPALRDDEGWQNSLSGKYIRRLIEVESWRISQDGPLNPGASQRPVYADEIPSMASTIGTVCENLKISFDGCGPSPVPSPVVVVSPTEQRETEAAAPLVMPKPESKSEPEPANSEPEPAARTVLPVIDLRGMDLGVPKSGEPDIWVKEEVAA